jgi:hypothetical protein
MSKLWIFGDSFAVGHHAESWPGILSSHFEVVNCASNGSSEYRIWRNYKDQAKKISSTDTVLFCHTSTSRVYLKDNETILSRLRNSHPLCDLIFADIFAKKEQKFINILKQIWDDRYFEDTYKMLKADLVQVPNSIHIDFFSRGPYNAIWTANPGTINHMTAVGNRLVVKEILGKL